MRKTGITYTLTDLIIFSDNRSAIIDASIPSAMRLLITPLLFSPRISQYGTGPNGGRGSAMWGG